MQSHKELAPLGRTHNGAGYSGWFFQAGLVLLQQILRGRRHLQVEPLVGQRGHHLADISQPQGLGRIQLGHQHQLGTPECAKQ